MWIKFRSFGDLRIVPKPKEIIPEERFPDDSLGGTRVVSHHWISYDLSYIESCTIPEAVTPQPLRFDWNGEPRGKRQRGSNMGRFIIVCNKQYPYCILKNVSMIDSYR